MTIQVFYLEDEDDIISIRDRLDWAEERQVVLVLPESGDVLARFLDLVLLRRHGDSLNIEIGLVTADHRVIGHAKTLGVPTFSSIQSATKNRRRWWRRKQRQEPIGQPTRVSDDDVSEISRRKHLRPKWQKWLLRYVALLGGLLALAALLVAAVYAIPGATITLRPELQDVQVTQQLLANPSRETIDSDLGAVPARKLVSRQEWQAEVETTGDVAVNDSPASGAVVFVNQLNQPVTVPTGTRLSTSAGERTIFQTLNEVSVPGNVGGTAEVEIIAIEPGESGNVEANRINRIEGPLALQLEVRNLEATSGGGTRLEKAVTESDMERLRSHVMQQIQVQALAQMEGQLSDREFLARDSLRVTQIIHETYSDFPGEVSDRLVVDIQADLQATAVDESQAVGVTYERLVESIAPGYVLLPDSLRFNSGEIIKVDNDGSITFEMEGWGVAAAELELKEPINQITGQQMGVAATYLFENLPLRDYPSIYLWPDWLGRVPYLPVRIRTNVDTGIW